MLNNFSWNMIGYIPEYAVNPHGDGIIPYVAERIFQLEPEPPAVDSLNEYILSALREKNLLYFSFFLHHYEPQLNKRIKAFLGVDGGDLYDTDRFIDIKLSCREQMLQKLMDYDPTKGAEYATYIYPFIRDAMLCFRMGEEKWSVSSLTNYKMVRSMAWLYHNTKDAISEFSKKYNCDLALAEEYLKVVRGIRNQQPFYVTDEDGEETGEDVALDDTWNYADILWNGIQAEKVQRAFEKLNYREQTLLEKRLSICMTCGRVGSWKNRPTFEELAVMFEGSTASGAERAYRKAVDKLTELLVAEGALHTVRLKQKSKTKRKKKIAAAIYEYQADCDGEWGEISLDFESGTAESIRLADWDTMKTNRFANKAIAYLLSCERMRICQRKRWWHLNNENEETYMEIKKFILDGALRTFHCYTSCPAEAGIELQTIVNTALDRLNGFLDDTYNAYKDHFPKVTRPILYIYLREDNVANINAFTEGKDIYLSVAAMIGMESYIKERLNTQKINGEDLVPEHLRTATHLRIYNYILELIIAHELTHIWHSHKRWKNAVLKYNGAPIAHVEDDVFSEKVLVVDSNNNEPAEADIAEIETLSIENGYLVCKSEAEQNYIQQILEVDADCCAMSIVIANLQKEMDSVVKTYANDPEKGETKFRAIISCHRYLLGLVAGAAGLMCGFFDGQRTEASFEKLSMLLDKNHPIPAIRFFKMNLTMNEMICTIFKDPDVAELLLSGTDAFSVDIFMHRDHTMNIKNCFWVPVQTKEAQDFIVLLEKGWNIIHDSLQSFALIDIPSKFSAEDLLIPDNLVWFDKNGNFLEKGQ